MTIDKRISYRFGGHPGASHEGAGSGQTSGGGGGGKPHMATAGGKDLNGLKSGIEASFDIIKNAIEG